MSIALVALGWILFVTTPCAVELSVWMGVAGCLCPISSSVILIGMAAFAFKNTAPNSASAADDMTAFIIVDIVKTAPLLGGNATSSD